MIYLLQNNALSYAKEHVNISKVSIIQALSSPETIVFAIEDSEYDSISRFFDLMQLDWKVIVGIPEVPTFNSILTERRSEVLISYSQFVEDTQNVSKELSFKTLEDDQNG